MSIPTGPVNKQSRPPAPKRTAEQCSGGSDPKAQRTDGWHGSGDWAGNSWRDDAWKGGSWSSGDWNQDKPEKDKKDNNAGADSDDEAGRANSSIGEQDRADIVQWQGCSKVGTPIPGTFVVPVKTPFEGPLQQRALKEGLITKEDHFPKIELLRTLAANGTPAGLVIDLVNTDKYYKGYTPDFKVEYKKVPIPGRSVPSPKDVVKVCDLIDEYVKRRPSKKHHVVVHCTHGMNRTGFFCAAYLLLRTEAGKKMGAREAVDIFEKARGAKMEKDYLIQTLGKIVAARPK